MPAVKRPPCGSEGYGVWQPCGADRRKGQESTVSTVHPPAPLCTAPEGGLAGRNLHSHPSAPPPAPIGAAGFEPATFRPPAECATRLRHAPESRSIARPLEGATVHGERATGIEPALRAWKAPVPPQHFARVLDRFDYMSRFSARSWGTARPGSLARGRRAPTLHLSKRRLARNVRGQPKGERACNEASKGAG